MGLCWREIQAGEFAVEFYGGLVIGADGGGFAGEVSEVVWFFERIL
jgi:hypothetical protein